MCLAIPVRVIEVRPDQKAVVDLAGVRKEISTALVEDVQPGEYVILHVGYAIGKVDAEEAARTLELFNQLEQAQSAERTIAPEAAK
jgi:hydrogenase expression/formation protein HypC